MGQSQKPLSSNREENTQQNQRNCLDTNLPNSNLKGFQEEVEALLLWHRGVDSSLRRILRLCSEEYLHSDWLEADWHNLSFNHEKLASLAQDIQSSARKVNNVMDDRRNQLEELLEDLTFCADVLNEKTEKYQTRFLEISNEHDFDSFVVESLSRKDIPIKDYEEFIQKQCLSMQKRVTEVHQILQGMVPTEQERLFVRKESLRKMSRCEIANDVGKVRDIRSELIGITKISRFSELKQEFGVVSKEHTALLQREEELRSETLALEAKVAGREELCQVFAPESKDFLELVTNDLSALASGIIDLVSSPGFSDRLTSEGVVEEKEDRRKDLQDINRLKVRGTSEAVLSSLQKISARLGGTVDWLCSEAFADGIAIHPFDDSFKSRVIYEQMLEIGWGSSFKKPTSGIQLNLHRYSSTKMPQVLEIFNDCHNTEIAEGDFVTLISKNRLTTQVVEDATGKVLGFMQYQESDGQLFLRELIVTEDMRREGIGSFMLNKLISEISDSSQGIKKLIVQTCGYDTLARQFLFSLGLHLENFQSEDHTNGSGDELVSMLIDSEDVAFLSKNLES